MFSENVMKERIPPLREGHNGEAESGQPTQDTSDIAIRVRNLSKCYQLYDRPEDRLKQILLPRLQRLISMEPRNYGHEFWALHDVSFEVSKGEAVGIIGRNGAGKSTLLQLICGTLSPTSGSVDVVGTVAALLELGSGFNPEFTGRENVYLNASVLGLTAEEINDRFDEIAAFADIGDFLEQPTKTYSSGMLMRLAFAVNACIRPEILVVDEALGVGDAPFQSKCYKRLRQIVDNGASVLFVSHDIATVRSVCSRALWVKSGQVEMWGDAKQVARCYEKYCWVSSGLQVGNENSAPSQVGGSVSAVDSVAARDHSGDTISSTNYGTKEVEIYSISLQDTAGNRISECDYNQQLIIKLQIVANVNISSEYLVGVRFRNVKGDWVLAANNFNCVRHLKLDAGQKNELIMQLSVPLTHDNYTVLVGLIAPKSGRIYTDGVYRFENSKIWHVIEEAAHFRVRECQFMPLNGPVHFPIEFID